MDDDIVEARATSVDESWFNRRHYNAIAKEIREIWPTNTDRTEASAYERGMLTTLALNLAKRFEKDNPRFDPFIFLNACSPNIDLYPLAELWEEVTNGESGHQDD